MQKVPVRDLMETDLKAVAEYYGLDIETTKHWVKIVIDLKG